MQDLVLIQTFLGLSLAVGIVGSGSTINKVCQISYKKFTIKLQYVCQVNKNKSFSLLNFHIICLKVYYTIK